MQLLTLLSPPPRSRYQINARTELAVRYNDISPLENHHCAVAFQILAQPECNIFSNVQPEGFKQIRQVCGAGGTLTAEGGEFVGGTVGTTTKNPFSGLPVTAAPTGILGSGPPSHRLQGHIH